ncbi:MAG: hypothetical protein JWN46_3805 [Acidimicrobiales bacterium]|nr:hypothetical protein [Acidimicrobiales bacterium]
MPLAPEPAIGEEPSPLLRLPVMYAVALALRDAGVEAAAIAVRLGIDQASVASVLAIGDLKLAGLAGPSATTTDPSCSLASSNEPDAPHQVHHQPSRQQETPP